MRKSLVMLGLMLALLGWLRYRGTHEISAVKPARANSIDNTEHPSVLQPTRGGSVKVNVDTAKTNTYDLNDPFTAFEVWVENYGRATLEEREVLLVQGITLAEKRREQLKILIKTDPQMALKRALSAEQREGLPASITNLLEAHVAINASLNKLSIDEHPNDGQLYAITADKIYRAHVYGRRTTQHSLKALPLVGIALDRDLAIDESPGRILSNWEITKLKVGQPELASLNPDQVVAQLGASTQVVESIQAAQALFAQVASREGPTGGALDIGNPAEKPEGWTFGKKKYLIMRINFPDETSEAITEWQAYDVMRQVNDFYTQNSYGKYTMLTTVTPLMTMPKTRVWYDAFDHDFDPRTDDLYTIYLYNDALEMARQHGFDPVEYDHTAVRFIFGGSSKNAGTRNWFNNNSPASWAKLFGYGLGMPNANEYNCRTLDTGGSNANSGNAFDNMGSGGLLHNNIALKNLVTEWLPDFYLTDVEKSGNYLIHAMDYGMLDPGKRYGLRIYKDDYRDYHIEYRRNQFQANSNAHNMVRNGVMLNWNPWWGNAGGSGLVNVDDNRPGRNILLIGHTLSDQRSGVHITPIRKFEQVQGVAGPEAIEVVVNLGDFPDNRTPNITLTASKSIVTTNEPITFTATASDPDGDELAYFWHFGGDNFGTNEPVQIRSFSQNGHYRVRCEVTDMKGQTASHSILITVGSVSTHTVSGIVTVNGQAVQNARVNGNTFTDSDGNYVLINQNGGTITANKPGYRGLYPPTTNPDQYGSSFEPSGFANPLASGQSHINKNFVGDPKQTITCAFMSGTNKVETVQEGSSVKLIVTRAFDSGPDDLDKVGYHWWLNNTELTVRFYVTFTDQTEAASLTDFSITPNGVRLDTPQGRFYYYDLKIDKGKTTAEATLTALADGLIEGPERITFTLAESDNFLPPDKSSSQLHLTILDSSAPPTVTIHTIDDTAREDSSDHAKFLIRRSGSTTAALNVEYTIGNAGVAGDVAPQFAQEGLDFVLQAPPGNTLNGSFTIPADVAELELTLVALPDGLVDPNEIATVYLKVPGDGRYRLGIPNFDWVRILDREPVTQVEIAFATAAIPEDSGSSVDFIVTRSDDLQRELTIPYAIGGKALNGVDYARLWGSVTLLPGEASARIPLEPYADSIAEDNESVILTLKSASHYNLHFNRFRSTIEIIEAGDRPHVFVEAYDGIMREALNEQGGFRFSRLNTLGNLQVFYTIGGTATLGADYMTVPGNPPIPFSGTITIPNGSSFVDIPLIPLTDNIKEETETIKVTLTPHTSYSIDRLAADAEIHIQDGTMLFDWDSQNGDLIAQLTVTSTRRTLMENGGIGDFYIMRTRDTDHDLDVAISLEGLAIPGTDYTIVEALTSVPVTNKVTIPAGAEHVRLLVTGKDDALGEGTETVTLRILPSSQYSVSPPSSDTLYILDDDPIDVRVAFQMSKSSAPEPHTDPKLKVALNKPSGDPVTVQYRIVGGSATGFVDYVLLPGTLTFSPGVTSVDLAFEVIDDIFRETHETIVIELFNPSRAELGSIAQHVYTIIDDESLPAIAFASANTSGSESNSDANIKVQLSFQTHEQVTVQYRVKGGTASPGIDFTEITGTVRFNPGQTVQAIRLGVIDDTDNEDNETVEIELFDPSMGKFSGGNPAHIYTILDNDPPPIVKLASDKLSVSEKIGTVALKVTLSKPATRPVTVNYAQLDGLAKAGLDYQLSPGVLIFQIGEFEKTLLIPIVDDLLEEVDEAFRVSLTSVNAATLGTPSVCEITILDDDRKPFAMSSGLAATPNPAKVLERVDFVATTFGGVEPIAWLWDFDDGFTDNRGSTAIHLFEKPGTYNVSVRATDKTGQSVKSSILVTIEPSGRPGGGNPSGGDPTALYVEKFKGKVNFAKLQSDAIGLKGYFNGLNFTPGAQTVLLNIGGVNQTFAMTNAKSTLGSHKLAMKKRKRDNAILFKISLRNGDYGSHWEDEGVLDTTVKDFSIEFQVGMQIMENNNLLRDMSGKATGSYTGKAGKTGSFRNR